MLDHGHATDPAEPTAEDLVESSSRWPRLLWPLLVTAAFVFVLVRVVSGGSGHHSAGPPRTPRPPTPTSSPAVPPSPSPSPDDEYLLDVPAEDMRAALVTAACRRGCTAQVLIDGALTRAAGGFPGLRPPSGGLVTRPGTGAYLQSVEGLAAPDALVHLYSERVALADAALRTKDSPAPDYRTVVLAVIRGGWRLTATIVVRGTSPPLTAARTWLHSSPLPH